MIGTRFFPRRPVRAASFAVCGCALLICGCGLSDYEKHIDEQRINLAAYDEESQALNPPLEAPQKIVARGKLKIPENALPIFFLRPPKWINSTLPTDAAPFEFKGVLLYKYPSYPGLSLLFTTAPLDRSPPPANQLVKGGIAPKDFRTRVRGALHEYVQRQYRETTDWKADDVELKDSAGWKKETFTLRRPRGKTVAFETKVFTAPPATKDPKQHAFKACFHTQGQDQAVVIYEVELGKLQDSSWTKQLDMSLKTLALGGEAGSMSQEYVMRNRSRPK